MIRLIKFLLIGDGHLHKWAIHSEGSWSDDCGQFGKSFWLRCECCGKMKYKR